MKRWVAAALAASVIAASAAGLARPSAAWDGCSGTPGDVRFTAADHTKLVAHRFGTGNTALVLVHQSDGDLRQWLPYGRRLAQLGYITLALDLRGHGSSQARGYPANQRYGGDVVAAVHYLRSHGARKVFILGASLGGLAAISGAANARPPVAGLISVSGAADLAGAIDVVGRARMPSLFLAGAGDTDFATDAKRLYRASGATDKALKVLPGAYQHGTQLVAANPRVRTLIEDFLRSH